MTSFTNETNINNFRNLLISSVVFLVLGFGAGYYAAKQTTSEKKLEANSLSSESKSSIEAEYEILFDGVKGQTIEGNYRVVNYAMGEPTRVEKVKAVLPYTIAFTAPEQSYVSTEVKVLGAEQSKLQVKILKNGSECVYTMVGSAVPNGFKSCSSSK